MPPPLITWSKDGPSSSICVKVNLLDGIVGCVRSHWFRWRQAEGRQHYNDESSTPRTASITTTTKTGDTLKTRRVEYRKWHHDRNILRGHQHLVRTVKSSMLSLPTLTTPCTTWPSALYNLPPTSAGKCCIVFLRPRDNLHTKLCDITKLCYYSHRRALPIALRNSGLQYT